MIPRTIPTWQSKSWQEELSSMVCDTNELLKRLNLDPKQAPDGFITDPKFPIRATDTFISKIHPNNWYDPLLRQIWPLKSEEEFKAGFSDDPLQEAQQSPAQGLIHKYRGRVLLISQPQCAIHCRYCFRREFDYQTHSLSRKQWQPALDYIEQNESIEEVILSGGDPLTSSSGQLEWLFMRLEEMSHITRLRIHTRIPLVLPKRIDDTLCQLLNQSRFQKVVVIHANHSNEIDADVKDSIFRLQQNGCTLLNQSVLLAGINDEAETLIKLSKSLFNMGVLPYYLHLLDKVTGTAHFEVPPDRAKTLEKALRSALPGYLVPKFVKELAGEKSKTPL